MLRPAQDHDLDAMRRWRNHPEVRGVSLTQHEISPEEHLAWWGRVQSDPTRRVLIYERPGTGPAGVVTFFDIDEKERTAWWSYFLDNAGLEEQGLLFPAWMSIQRDAIRYAKRDMRLSQLHAETLASNTAAAEFNTRQGLRELERYTRDIDGNHVEVIHTVLTFEEQK